MEGLRLGQAAGLNLVELYSVLSTSFGASRMLERSVPVVMEGEFRSPFTVDLLSKDLALVEALAGAAGVELPVTAAVRRQFNAAQRSGLGERDAAALITLLHGKETALT